MTEPAAAPSTDAAAYIDQLIGTYRELNLRVRPLPEARLSADHGGESIRQVVSAMRDHELTFSQWLKERTADFPRTSDEAPPPITGLETEADSTAMLISQFGTARGTTLSTLKALPPEAWRTQRSDGTDLEDAVRDLVARDKDAIERILSMLTS
jgi:hypothetical protein